MLEYPDLAPELAELYDQTYRVRLVGLPPGLLMNPMDDEQLEDLRKKTPKPKRRDISRYEEAKTRIITDGNGTICLKLDQIYACLKWGGKSVSFSGRAKVTASNGSTNLYTILYIPGELFPLKVHGETARVAESGKEQDEVWMVDGRKGNNPQDAKHTAVAIIRPKFLGWELELDVLVNSHALNPQGVKAIFTSAGQNAGLCDFRPSRGGPFGRFVVREFVEMKAGAKKVV